MHINNKTRGYHEKKMIVFIYILCCICWAYDCEVEQLINTNEVQATCKEKRTNYVFQITIKKDASKLVWVELNNNNLTIYRTVKANNGITNCSRDEIDEHGISNVRKWTGCLSPIEEWKIHRKFYGF